MYTKLIGGEYRLNKQRFIAELTQLLSFMAEHDRAAFLKQLNAKFDEVGPEGEAGLIARLGTPTALAIKVSRSYTPTAAPAKAEPEETEKPVQEPEEETPQEPKPEQERETEQETSSGEEQTPEPEPEPETAQEPEQKAEAEAEAKTEAEIKVEAKAEGETAKPALSELFGGENPAPEIKQEQEKDKKASRGRGALITLTVTGGTMLLCVLLAACAVVFAPGAGGLCAAAVSVLAGLWASPVFTDALFLFGIAAIALALGVFLLFLAVWLIVAVVKPLVSGIVYLFRLTGGEDK